MPAEVSPNENAIRKRKEWPSSRAKRDADQIGFASRPRAGLRFDPNHWTVQWNANALMRPRERRVAVEPRTGAPAVHPASVQCRQVLWGHCSDRLASVNSGVGAAWRGRDVRRVKDVL